MSLTIEELELNATEIELARNRIRQIAHEKWEEAGCPHGDGLPFWIEAEEEWIVREYVPHRENVDAIPRNPR